jgi:UDP-N-acetylmuramyl pentapeptide phosphotransferase/UDP-N-acetylglucosamine-1-phosphate transferase
MVELAIAHVPSGNASVSLLTLALGFLAATLLGWALSEVVARVSRHFGLLDRPRGRHAHLRAAPRLGGVAIFLAFALVAALLYRPAALYEGRIAVGLFAAAALTVAVMAIDDLRSLPAWPRLLAQAVAAALVMFPGAQGLVIAIIHNPLASGASAIVPLPWWIALPFTAFWIIGMMNTINWMDGVDGLAGGVVMIAAVVMATIAWLLGQHTVALLCALLAGATLGFLVLNWRPGALFMGDSGAMFLGLALATLAGMGGAKLATMLLLLSLPIIDATWVIFRRIQHGRTPLRADRSHLHYRLLASGMSQRQVALLFYVITGAFGAVTILAAYLQAHSWRWTAIFQLTPWLNVAETETPTLIGLALVPAVTLAVWALVWRRRAAPSPKPEEPPPTTPSAETNQSVALAGGSGQHPQPKR